MSTGAQYTSKSVACRECVMELWGWVFGRQGRKPRRGGPSFYDHVNRVVNDEDFRVGD